MRRDAVVREIQNALTAWCPGSRVDLRGSLAAGTADEYSDIDLAWTVPDQRLVRVGAGAATGDWAADLERLPRTAVAHEPALESPARRVRDLVGEHQPG